MSPCGWTDVLARRLRLSRLEKNPNLNTTSVSNPAGRLWRAALAQAIYSDLSLGLKTGRRFIRFHCLGLNAVIFYEYPATGSKDGQQCLAIRELTLASVFGNDSNPEKTGMDIEDLIEHVDAKLIYFPSYSCTSFMVGQVMTSFFYCPQNRLEPVRDGFLVQVPSVHHLADSATSSSLSSADASAKEICFLRYNACFVNSTMQPLSMPSVSCPSNPLPTAYGSVGQDGDCLTSMDISACTTESFGPATPPDLLVQRCLAQDFDDDSLDSIEMPCIPTDTIRMMDDLPFVDLTGGNNAHKDAVETPEFDLCRIAL